MSNRSISKIAIVGGVDILHNYLAGLFYEYKIPYI